MCLEPKGNFCCSLAEMCVCYVAELDVCSHALSLAYTIITEERYKVEVDCTLLIKCNSMLFRNPRARLQRERHTQKVSIFIWTPMGSLSTPFMERKSTSTSSCTRKGLSGDIAGCTSVKEFIDWFISFKRFEKVDWSRELQWSRESCSGVGCSE